MLKYSTLAILSVFSIEVFLGLVAGSLAILSDGLHAFFDTLSSLMLFISLQASIKPPDEEHMYGHEKFEPLGGLIGGFVLIVLAIITALEAISGILRGEPHINMDLSLAGFIALAYTLSIDLLRMFIFRSSFKDSSPTIKAGFYHAISDMGSTLIALLGYWLSTYGVIYGDYLASLTLSALLIFLSAKFVRDNIMELSDVAPKGAILKVKEEISNVSGDLFTCENLRIRRSGGKIFIRATLKVPDYMSLDEAHKITTEIEKNITRALGDTDILFHIEPCGIGGMRTEKFIEDIVSEIEGVTSVHDVNLTYYNRKVYATLHVQVEPTMPLSEAHALAERIEKKILNSITNVGNVLVHIEPSNIELERGHVMDEDEIDRLAQIVVKKYGDGLKIKRIATYIANGRRYINIECVSLREIPVEEAHKISSEIEDTIREKISNVIVTVHMETDDVKGMREIVS